MSADINTEITLKGTSEELAAFLKTIRAFSYTGSDSEDAEEEKCAYLEWVIIHVGEDSRELDDLSINDLKELIGGGELSITAEGPYGKFGELSEVGLFEALAEAAPTAWFSGSCSGFVTCADVRIYALLEERKLYLLECYLPDEAIPDSDEEYQAALAESGKETIYDPIRKEYIDG